jgi:uncharacterized protein YjbJ (UPF0337 family)
MDKSQAERWDHHLKEVFKEKWEKLTEDDFKKAEGSIFKLYGVILTKTNGIKEFINEKSDQRDQK